jgi:redox-regulated HSP33 family molecular chaperone
MPVNNPNPFSSECPNCHQDRVLSGYTREELGQLLKEGAEIEAYCGSCDEHWPISVEDRADIARGLGAGKGG